MYSANIHSFFELPVSKDPQNNKQMYDFRTMDFKLFVFVAMVCIINGVVAAEEPVTTIPPDYNNYPQYQPSMSQGAPSYVPPKVPHATYPYIENTYGIPYNGGNIEPQGGPQSYLPSYQTSIAPGAQSALVYILSIAIRLGRFLIGAVGLLLVGSVFTSAVCYMTPICTFTFNGFSGVPPATARALESLLTPENLTDATMLLHRAISKYNQLQKDTGVKQ